MVRSLSRGAAAAVALLFACGPLPAWSAPTAVGSLSELRACLERSSMLGPVDCVVDEVVTITTSGNAVPTNAIFGVTLPTTNRLEAALRFTPTGCFVWNHTGAEPDTSSTAVRILEINAPSGVDAGSRLRIDSPCIREQRAGVDGGSAATDVRGLVVTGDGRNALDARVENHRISISSSGAGSVDLAGVGSSSDGWPSAACLRGDIQGRGYNPRTRRWESTCGDFNWHGWSDPSQLESSYAVECTGDGTPHLSCVRAGETLYVGYPIHRHAVAAQYTADGGTVHIADRLYVDSGAGLQRDGVTRAQFPKPFDPDWEARSDFAVLGYPTELRAVVMNRGVRIVGQGWTFKTHSAGDSTVSSNRPFRAGTFSLDDRGNAGGGFSGADGPTLDGETGIIEPIGQYRYHVGFNRLTTYCLTTSNSDPRCVTNNNSSTQEMPDANLWGIDFPTLANIASTNMNICVPDTDWTGLGTGQSDAKGTCSLNRKIRCWDQTGAADVARASGGCDFGAGGDFGVCQAPFEALQADYTTAGQDLQVVLHLTECPDNATSSADCATPLGNDIWISDLRAAPGGSIAGASCDSGNGTNVQLGNARPVTNDFSSALTFPTFYVGGSGAVNRIFPIARGSMDLKGAGFERMARMPANWLTRNSSNDDADCLSGGNISNADDEEACDTDTLSGFASGYNGRIGPNVLFAYTSQATGNKSAVVETFPGGGPNYFEGNTVDTHFRQTLIDWGTGYLRRNVFRNLFAFGTNAGGGNTTGGFVACFSGDCRIVENRIENSSITYGILANRAVANVLSSKNEWTNVGHGDALYLIRGPKNFTVDDDSYSGLFSNVLAKVEPGEFGKQQPTVTLRNLTSILQISGVASGTSTGAGHPNAMVLVEGWDASETGADDFKSILIDNVNLRNSLGGDSCLLWIEDDWDNVPASTGSEDVSALTRESASRITVSNSSIAGVGSPAIACVGRYDYQATIFDASDSRSWAVEPFAPELRANRVNGVAVPDMTRTLSEASLGLASAYPHGTVVRLHDGAAGCAHTGGNLTAGGAVVTCVNDQGANTWAEFP